ncbi:MAG: 23S rRNA (pseudouridine(1915)-N(3))-methyltransferase RlmH [Prevotellaceae bacterium]|jgi:23S rRNA (pseudouridine1915-N3)-methyltransferase|nr:23S rRNA (pseudouridine(1915)-N(3))-methyltransferase RlmH [Prevotellaceae bacterium]
MKITLLAIGKTNQAWLEEAVNEYIKRVKRYITFDFKIILDVRNAKNLSEEQLKEKESELLLASLLDVDELFLLDEKGRQYSSEEFAGFIEKKMLTSTKSLVFCIGGAYGFSGSVYKRAVGKISFSKMTFSHQMVRLIATEQLYRAFSIIKNEPYHHK